MNRSAHRMPTNATTATAIPAMASLLSPEDPDFEPESDPGLDPDPLLLPELLEPDWLPSAGGDWPGTSMYGYCFAFLYCASHVMVAFCVVSRAEVLSSVRTGLITPTIPFPMHELIAVQ